MASRVFAVYRPPAGAMQMFAGAAAPAGWLMCDGAAVSRTLYALLWAAIGTTYGVGDGATTFNLPDLRDRVPIGARAATDHVLGQAGGLASNDLTHLHGVGTLVNSGPSATGAIAGALASAPTATHVHTISGSTANVAGMNAVENRPPYLGLNFIIKT